MQSAPSPRGSTALARVSAAVISLILVTGLASLAALYLTGFRYQALVGRARLQSFISPDPPSDDAAAAYWSRRNSRIAVPYSPWQPAHVGMELRASPEAPEGRTTVEITVNGVTKRFIAGKNWEAHRFDVKSDPPGPAAIDIASTTSGPRQRGAGIRGVRVSSTLTAIGAAWALVTGLASALGLALLVLRAIPGVSPRWPLARRATAFCFAGALAASLVTAAAVFGAAAMTHAIARLVTVALGEAARMTLLLALLALPGWAIALKAGFARADADPESAALVSTGATLAILGGLLLPLQMAGASPFVFNVVFVAVYVASIVAALGAPGDRRRTMRVLASARAVFLLPLILACAAVFYLSVGVEALADIRSWHYAAQRYFYSLPTDNNLSWITSETWTRHLAPNALYEGSMWRIGDRGPLLSAAHSFLTRALEPFPQYAWYLRLGILLNALFAGSLFVLMRRTTGSRATAWIGAALVGLNPWFFLNVYYTWPKLLAAHLGLSAILTLWRDGADSPDYALAGGFFGLAILAHPGAIISLPAFALVTLWRFDRARTLTRWLLFCGILVLTMSPWLIYKRVYSPETFNLLTAHYLDAQGYGEPVVDNIRRFFQDHPWHEQIAHRVGNLQNLWWGWIEWRAIGAFWIGQPAGQRLAAPEFFWPWHSTGVLWFVLIPAGWLLTALGVLSRPASPMPGRALVSASLVMAGVGLSLNAVVRWRESLSHEVPYLDLLLIAVCGLALIRRHGAVLLSVAGGAIAARQWFYFEESARVSPLGLPAMDVNGVLFWLASAALLLTSLHFVRDELTAPSASEAVPCSVIS